MFYSFIVNANAGTIEKVAGIVMRSSIPLAVQADGEVLSLGATRVTMEVVARGLNVRMPVKR